MLTDQERLFGHLYPPPTDRERRLLERFDMLERKLDVILAKLEGRTLPQPNVEFYR